MIECYKFMNRKSNSKNELEDMVAYGPKESLADTTPPL